MSVRHTGAHVFEIEGDPGSIRVAWSGFVDRVF